MERFFRFLAQLHPARGGLCYHCRMKILVLLLLMLQTAVPTPQASVEGMPAGDGVYYRKGADWIRLRPASISDMETKGLENFVDTGGYTDFTMKISLQGPRASLRLRDQRPVFYVRGVYAAQNAKGALLLRLERQKRKRVSSAAFSSASVDNKGGFNQDAATRTAVEPHPGGVISLTPEGRLVPGEYLLVFSYATAGFDFGVDAAK